MRYPITPDFLESAPESVVQLYRDLEEFVLSDICRRFKLSGEATESALEQIRILQRHGLALKEIEHRIKQTLNLSEQEFDEIYQRAVDRNQEYFDYAISKADIVQDAYNSAAMARQVDAIRRQTQSEFVNLTQSLGFALRGADGKVQFLPIAKTYQKILDDAEMQVWSGAVDYNTAIRGAVKRLTDSGLQTVDYASGWHNRVDVAARRAVMTGVSQMSARYSEQMMDTLDTRYVETTAHRGARDVDGPKGWENHKKWQGKWYYWSRSGESDPLGQYPDFVKTTGYGDVTGLCGANCRHHFYSVIPGVSEPTYTAEQLANIDPPPFTYQGKEYTIYQATQKQRQLETAMRDCKRKMAAYKSAGLEEDYTAAASRLRALSKEYKQFSAAAGLRTQPERARVQGFGTKEAAQARSGILNAKEQVAADQKPDIMSQKDSNGDGAEVKTIGKIDVEKYRVVTDNIRTDEVIITDERIQHIKERHPNDFERYSQYLKQIVESPDYILEANKPNTAFLLKEFAEEDERFQLILRLAVEGDIPGYKNSIITFLKVEEKRYRRYLRTKKILYKSE